MITLYEFALSGNCHKVRLMLSLLGLDYRSVLINGSEQQQKSVDYLAMNPFGQVPVLADDEVVVRDSQAILVYLAKNTGTGNGCRMMPQRWQGLWLGFPRLPMK